MLIYPLIHLAAPVFLFFITGQIIEHGQIIMAAHLCFARSVVILRQVRHFIYRISRLLEHFTELLEEQIQESRCCLNSDGIPGTPGVPDSSSEREKY